MNMNKIIKLHSLDQLYLPTYPVNWAAEPLAVDAISNPLLTAGGTEVASVAGAKLLISFGVP